MERINVTKTFLPPFAEYEAYLRQIWERDWLTNQGPLLLEFQEKVSAYLDVERFHFVANGTMALQLALRALEVDGGEVITTPFSYVATTSSILWEHSTPVFVDIEPQTFCMDPAKIEAAITPRTKAILPVHVFGNPCAVEEIEAIAQKHGLKVIYDAAHAFAVRYKGEPLAARGDISILSFHATKLFHTIEGGALVVKDKAVSERVELMKRFGHNGDEHLRLGINAKATEFQAAMGLCNLKYVEALIEKRRGRFELYHSLLGSAVQKPAIAKDTAYNYAYYPVVFKDEASLLAAFRKLEAKNIFPRRYFYPSLNKLPYITQAAACPVSEDIALRIACLPLHADLEDETIRAICEAVNA